MFQHTWIPCECKASETHVFTSEEYGDAVKNCQLFSSLIKDHGWNLSVNYHCNFNKINGECNAWDVDNTPYLVLRGQAQDRYDWSGIPIPLKLILPDTANNDE